MAVDQDSPFHAGEKALQRRAGVAERSASLGQRMIRSQLQPSHQAFADQAGLLLLGSSDGEGRPWASLLTGAPGFVDSADPATLRIGARPAAGDPLAANLQRAGVPLATLAIDLEHRVRLRVNGHLASVDDEGFALTVAQAYGNCDMYIQTRAIPPAEMPPSPAAAQLTETVSREAAQLIADADTFFIASQTCTDGAVDSLDISHRGGPPGFVIVAHERCLLFPDYPGNGMFNTLGNLHLDPRAGLLFVDFSTGNTVQLSGRASVLWDDHHISRFPGAERVVALEVEAVRFTPAAVPAGWDFGEYSPVFDTFPMPSLLAPAQDAPAATIQSINLAMPKTVDNHGAPVATGIFKQPAAGPVNLRRLNLEGDGQADLWGHGGAFRAVYVYPQEHYAYWAGELGRDDFAPGQFGENFTVSGFDEERVRVGDVYEVGEAMVEVSQPRVPCYKLALKMGIDGFESVFLRSGRIGFYLRVIRGGVLKAGDRFKLVGRDPAGMSVRAVSDLLYFNADDLDATKQALSIRALAHGWKGSFEERLAAAEREAAANALREFVVERKVAESETITSFYLAPADGKPLAPFKPGQFLTFELDPPGQDDTLVRTYSLSDAPGKPWYRISVKREAPPREPPGLPPGASSTYLHDQVQEGMMLHVGAPRGKFVLSDLNGERPLVLLSGGVGITPLLSMLNAVVEGGATRPVWFVHGTRNGQEHAFGAHVRELAQAHDNVHVHVRYSAPRDQDIEGVDYDSVGRVDVALLKQLLPFDDYEFYMVGPTGFMRSLYADLTAMQISPSRIHYEFFGPAEALGIEARQPPAVPSQGARATVTFEASGVTASWDGQGSLLDLAEAQGLSPPYSCRSGICQTCRCRLVAGEVNYAEAPLTPPPAGEVLVCIAEPAGEEVVLDL